MVVASALPPDHTLLHAWGKPEVPARTALKRGRGSARLALCQPASIDEPSHLMRSELW